MLEGIIQLSVFWGVGLLCYALLFRSLTFFKANRIWLLSVFVTGLALPLWQPFILERSTATQWLDIDDFALRSGENMLVEKAVQMPSLFEIALLVWAIGAAIAFLRVCLGIFRIYQQLKGHAATPLGVHRVYHIEGLKAPFSYFHHIALPAGLEPSKELAILKHEQGHARLGHSFDIMLISLVQIIFWWHPLVYMFKHELRLLHEYEADATALHAISIPEYGYLLLVQSLPNQFIPPIVNPFFHSFLKKRINMMTKKPSSFRTMGRYLLAIPALLSLVMLFSFRNEVPTEGGPNKQPVFDATCVGKPDEAECSNTALMTFVFKNLKYPEAAAKNGLEGTVVVKFLVEENGNVTAVEIKKGADQQLNDEAIRMVKSMPKWVPGEKDGKKVPVEMFLPVKFKLGDKNESK